MSKSSASLTDPLLHSTQEFFNDPYPVFDQLRREAPVFWSEKGEYWLVSRYNDAHEILGDLHFEKGARRFKQMDAFAKLIPRANEMLGMRKNMLNANPPDHTRLRALVNKAFTPSMVSQMRSHIEDIANELIDDVKDKGHMDLINDFSFPLPATVIAEMLGIPAKDRDRFKGWSHAITAMLDPNPNPNMINMAKTIVAVSELTDYLKPLVEERRNSRQKDLISALLGSEEDGQRLEQSELLSNIVLLLIAGHETTTNLIGNGTYALLRHPSQLAALKNNFELMPAAIQELLRYDSPVQIVRRIAAQDIEIGGQKIANGQTVLLLIGAANRDPDEFENADQLNITRSKNKHLAFGHGIHHCLGSSLAETEGQIAITQLLKRLPNMQLAQRSVTYKHPFSLRGLTELKVTF